MSLDIKHAICSGSQSIDRSSYITQTLIVRLVDNRGMRDLAGQVSCAGFFSGSFRGHFLPVVGFYRNEMGTGPIRDNDDAKRLGVDDRSEFSNNAELGKRRHLLLGNCL